MEFPSVFFAHINNVSSMKTIQNKSFLKKTYRPTITTRKRPYTKGLSYGRSYLKTYHRPTIDLP